MKIDYDPAHVEETRYVEPVEINIVEITQDFDIKAEEEVIESNRNQMQYV